MTTTPTSEIICTKSQFRAALAAEFAVAMVDTTEANMAEVRQAIADLAQQADNTRGVFSGYSDYLDLAYTVAPDGQQPEDDEDECDGHESLSGVYMGQTVFCDGTCCPRKAKRPDAPKADLAAERMAGGGQLNNVHPGMLPREIPAVTDEQRAQSREAADASIRQAVRGLNGAAAMLREHANDPQMIEALSRDVWQLSNVLTAAAGHLRIAQQ